MRWALVALALAAAARAEQPLAVYPGTVHTRIGNDLVIGGEYYRIAYFMTKDPLKKVAEFFRTQWKDDGYPVTADGDFVEEGVVSAFYTREGLVRSIVLRKHGDRTLGFTVLKDLWVRPKPEASAPPLPPVEGALFAQETGVRDEGGGSFGRTALVPLGLNAAVEQVLKPLLAQHFELAHDTRLEQGGQAQRVIEAGRGGEQVVLTFAAVENDLTAVQQTYTRSDRPDAVPNGETQERRAGEKRKKK